jgi:hypothetical protein
MQVDEAPADETLEELLEKMTQGTDTTWSLKTRPRALRLGDADI